MEYKTLKLQLRRAGYRLEMNGTGHFNVIDPVTGSKMGTVPATPSDWRSCANAASQLRAAGVKFDRRLSTQPERRVRAAEVNTASKRVTQLIDAAESVTELTAENTAEILGVTKGNAAQILAKAVEVGALVRVRRGVYTRRKEVIASIIQIGSSHSWSLESADSSGAVVLRDNEGELWIAAPLKAALLALGQQATEISKR